MLITNLPKGGGLGPMLVLALALCLGAEARGSDDIHEIRADAERLWQTLAAMPYAARGSGPVLYTFEFSECPYSQQFYREWNTQLEGIEVRRLFFAVSQRSANETAALARSRDADDYGAFMEGRKRAPRVDDPRMPAVDFNRNVDHFNSVMGPVNEVVQPILRSNGVITGGLISPTLIWREQDKVYAAGGYELEHVATITARIQAAARDTVSER